MRIPLRDSAGSIVMDSVRFVRGKGKPHAVMVYMMSLSCLNPEESMFAFKDISVCYIYAFYNVQEYILDRYSTIFFFVTIFCCCITLPYLDLPTLGTDHNGPIRS